MSVGTVISGIGSDDLFSIIADGRLPSFSLGNRKPADRDASGYVEVIFNTGHEAGQRLWVKTSTMLNKPLDDVEYNKGLLNTFLHYPVDDQDNSWFTTYSSLHSHPDEIFARLVDELELIGLDTTYYGEDDDIYWILSGMSEDDE